MKGSRAREQRGAVGLVRRLGVEGDFRQVVLLQLIHQRDDLLPLQRQVGAAIAATWATRAFGTNTRSSGRAAQPTISKTGW